MRQAELYDWRDRRGVLVFLRLDRKWSTVCDGEASARQLQGAVSWLGEKPFRCVPDADGVQLVCEACAGVEVFGTCAKEGVKLRWLRADWSERVRISRFEL